MIRKFRFKNFCSFADEVEMNFTASGKLDTNDSFISSATGDKVSTLLCVVGANGSGKTSFLKALVFVHSFIIRSFQDSNDGAEAPCDAFFTRKDMASEFYLEFENKADKYRYTLKCKSGRVITERLSKHFKETKSYRTIASRGNTAAGNPSVKLSDEFIESSVIKNLLVKRPNTSLISAGLVTNHKAFVNIVNTLRSSISNVTRVGKVGHEGDSLDESIFEAAAYFLKHENHRDNLLELLKASDIGVKGIDIREMLVYGKGNDESGELPVPFLTHSGPDGDFELPIFMESSGTKRIFGLFKLIIEIIDIGGIAIIDEMESDLHPHMIPFLLNLFARPSRNPNQSQLLFTCHHVEVLNHLDKEQIVLVEKNANCVSDAYHLSDVEGVRREENFFANYNAGKYSAVPELSFF